MNTAQKFEEGESALDQAKAWLNEMELVQDLWTYSDAVYGLLNAFQDMILGDRDWEACSEVKSGLEKAFLEKVVE